MEVAFIGLGTMGAGMARNLITGGHRVRVFDVSENAMAPFRDLATVIAGSPAEAASGARVAMTMLPDSPQVRDALLGPQGVCHNLTGGGLVIDMSTISAHESDKICREIIGRGFRFTDAPIGRTPRDAVAGTSLIIAGGHPADIEEARPLFDCIGDKLIHA